MPGVCYQYRQPRVREGLRAAAMRENVDWAVTSNEHSVKDEGLDSLHGADLTAAAELLVAELLVAVPTTSSWGQGEGYYQGPNPGVYKEAMGCFPEMRFLLLHHLT